MIVALWRLRCGRCKPFGRCMFLVGTGGGARGGASWVEEETLE